MPTRTFVTCLEILHSLLLAIIRSRQRRTRHTRWCGHIPAGEADDSRVERFPRRKLVCALPAVRHGNSECLNFDGIVVTSWGALSNDEHIYRSLSLVYALPSHLSWVPPSFLSFLSLILCSITMNGSFFVEPEITFRLFLPKISGNMKM